MVIFIFLEFGMVKRFETLQTISNMKMNIFQRKIFNEITLLLFMIYSFIKFKVLVSLPKNFHGSLGMRMHCNWPTDHAIDHSSIGLKRLTIQPVFNEVSLFTFSEGTPGFDVTVPKNYLKHYNVRSFRPLRERSRPAFFLIYAILKWNDPKGQFALRQGKVLLKCRY